MNFKDTLLKEYADMLDVKEATGHCRVTYFPHIKDFITFCGTSYPDSLAITKGMLDDWLQKKCFRTNATYNSAISRIREFCKYQAAIGKSTYIPSGDYSAKTIRFVPYIFTDEELGELFKAFDSAQPHALSPDREFVIPVLFRMMYCCGLRPAEPLNLLYEDVDLESGVIYIRRAKRIRDRRVLMSEDMIALCRKYDSRKYPRTYFFEREDGSRFPTHWMTKQFHVCWRNSGLEKRLNPRPYDLRHNFATRVLMRWLSEKNDVMAMVSYLSAYMGHAEFTSTLYYIHLLPERLRNCEGIDWERFSSIYPEVTNEED